MRSLITIHVACYQLFIYISLLTNENLYEEPHNHDSSVVKIKFVVYLQDIYFFTIKLYFVILKINLSNYIIILYLKINHFNKCRIQKYNNVSLYLHLYDVKFFLQLDHSVFYTIWNICIRVIRGRRCIERHQLSYIYWAAAPQLPPSTLSFDFSHEFVRLWKMWWEATCFILFGIFLAGYFFLI